MDNIIPIIAWVLVAGSIFFIFSLYEKVSDLEERVKDLEKKSDNQKRF